MSELKAISGHEIREDIDYNTRGIDPEDKEWRNYGKELCDTLYYRKSEADKEIQRLEKLCENYRCDCDNLAIMTDKMRKAGRTLRLKMNYQKYKRCLAMANYWVAVSYHCVDDKHRQSAERHHRKWLELAKKFNDKEAK